MPNMRLNEVEVDALIEYIEEETTHTLVSATAGRSTAFGWDDFVDAGLEDDGWGLEGSEPVPEEAGGAPESCCLKRENVVLGPPSPNRAP